MFSTIKQLFVLRQEESTFRPPALGDSGGFKMDLKRYTNGMLSDIRDLRGRAWTFTYAGGKTVRFTDPSGTTWCEENGRWHGFAADGRASGVRPPLSVRIDQSSGEICWHEEERELIYKPDGTTCIRWEEQRDGVAVQIAVTEYATMPGRTRVTVEKHQDGAEYLRSVEDANGRCYKFDYVNGQLHRMTDWSGRTPMLWQAVRDAKGALVKWICEDDGHDLEMVPHLESVDLQGNRYYRTLDGRSFVVKPNGSAVMGSMR